MTPPQAALYMATVAPGLERVAEAEVLETIPGGWTQSILRGRVLFGAAATAAEVQTLRCADNIYLHIAWLRIGRTRADLPRLRQSIAELDLGKALQRIAVPPQPAAFVNASRAGRHTYSRFEAAEAAMEALAEAHGLRLGSAERHDLEFRLDIIDDKVLFSLRLTPPGFRFRGESRQFGPAALRPTVAHALVRLSEPQADDVFLDPFCGSGTIAAERAFYAARRIVACDLDPQQAAMARRNAPAHVEVVQCDARRLPFADESVSVIVANPPWGGQVQVADTGGLYAGFLREGRRVLAPDGKILIITDREEALLTAAAAVGLHAAAVCAISLHGLVPSVYKLSKNTLACGS